MGQTPLISEVDRYVLFQICVYFMAFWLLLEIGFVFVVYVYLLPSLQRLNKPLPFPTDKIAFMRRILASVKEIPCYTFEAYISGFFRGAHFKDVHFDNFRSFLSWAMFGKHLPDLNEKEVSEVKEVSDYAAQVHPAVANMSQGFNPEVKHCAMTLEPVPMIHRPLCLYVGAALMETIANALFLRACGFQSLEIDGMTYWYKKHSGADSANTSNNNNNVSESSSTGSNGSSNGSEPLVFLHGISTGWMLYLQIAKALGRNRTMVLVDLDAIKIKSMTFHMPSPQQFSDRFQRLLNRHHIDKCSLVGHSFGSITAGWLMSRCPELVAHLTLIDPVSMLLAFPEVAYSFLYRPPSSVTEWIIHLAAARELTISHTLHRHFSWYNNNLWLEDVPAHIGVVVGIASQDEIVNPKALQEYVQNCRARRQEVKQPSQQHMQQGDVTTIAANMAAPIAAINAAAPIAEIECVVWEGYSHGQILLPTNTQSAFISAVHRNEKLGTSGGSNSSGSGGAAAKSI